MEVIINPGSGPVAGATHEQAQVNIQAFVEDLKARGVWDVVIQSNNRKDRGRYIFDLHTDKGSVEVEMPGIPLEKVRWHGDADGNIWDFPRLYCDGSSWIWIYALNSAESDLKGEVDE